MRRDTAIGRASAWLAYVALGLSLAFAFATTARAQTSASGADAQRPIDVLFVGNSYTFYNDMPGILAELGNAPASARRIRTKSYTIGRANLKELWGQGWNSMPGKFDYVVLQEGAPTLASRPEETAQYARFFDAAIRASGAKTVLLVPWAHEQQRDSQPAMDRSIQSIAKDLGAAIAPAGTAWSIARERAPGLALYLPDQRHPTPIGSYIAACVIYLVLLPDREACPVIAVQSASASDIAVAQYAASRGAREASAR